MQYNLLHDAWVPVIRNARSYELLSLTELFRSMNQVQLAMNNPMDRFAIFRFVLSVLYWCREKTGQELLPDGSIPGPWLDFLLNNEQHFELFGSGNRFYQFQDVKRLRPITDLIHEIPTGNNFIHFQHTQDYSGGLCLECTVLGLLRLPLYSVSGLPDLKSGINGSPPIYLCWWGHSLMDTIRLNWAPAQDMGVPAWVDPTPPDCEAEVSLLAGMTALSRRCYLKEDTITHGFCCHCGKHTDKLIMQCGFESAGSLENKTWIDPHVAYGENRSVTSPNPLVDSSVRNDKPWYYAVPAYLANHPARYPASLFMVGFVTDKAKYVDVWEDTYYLSAPDPETGEDFVITDWRSSVTYMNKRIVAKLRSEHADDHNPQKAVPSKHKESLAKLTSALLSSSLESSMPHHGKGVLNNSDADWTSAGDKYTRLIRSIAGSLYPARDSRSQRNRRALISVKPYPGSKTDNHTKEEQDAKSHD